MKNYLVLRNVVVDKPDRSDRYVAGQAVKLSAKEAKALNAKASAPFLEELKEPPQSNQEEELGGE